MSHKCRILWILIGCWIFGSSVMGQERTVVPLDGQWEVAQGGMEQRPDKFEHRIPVPGLIDMAQPAFTEVGKKSPLREAFWYRRTFQISTPVPEVALLKIYKAAYGTRVWLNGKLVGDHVGCFTPGYFDLREHLKPAGEDNELVVRVGASRESLPPNIPGGFDFEKILYTPGIYDTVELILSKTPFVVRVQAVPMIEEEAVRVVAVVRSTQAKEVRLFCEVREAGSGNVVSSKRGDAVRVEADKEATCDLRISMPSPRLWSPEDPFLYELVVSTGADTYTTRFGMRSFRLDPKTGQAVLNGKPYFLRGTNVCIFRFFEDAARGDKPWKADWVRKLHRAFRSMNWNSARYCIGFPPEQWYRIADETGMLIQNEFPLWYGGKLPEEIKAADLIAQYTEWMQEHWNHPCVAIWDAQNETANTEETGKAIQAVRGLDLSNRPWDNGWSKPQADNDVYEAHPYLFHNPNARLSELGKLSPSFLGNPSPNKGGNPMIINEYGWLWLNRDGTPTTLTKKLYENLLGADATSDQRRVLYARCLAAETEYFRSLRRFAGILHFCGLGYARKDGQTSDNFADLETLTFEPNFYKYVRDAFMPVGVMVNEWAEVLEAGQSREVPVVVINDLYQTRKATVRLRLSGDNKAAIFDEKQTCEIEPLGRVQLKFSVALPKEAGKYQFVAELRTDGQDPIQSLRDFEVLTAEQMKARDGLAVGKKVKASSVVTVHGESFPAEYVVDGKTSTRWSSEFSDPQWIAIDLGEAVSISRVELLWEAAHTKVYSLEVSDDGEKWTEVYKTDKGAGGRETVRFTPVKTKWLRLNCAKRATEHGNSLWEIRVFP